ncbi:MAG: hypothetical protein COB56_05425 [Robiginitomaculum sp.]|nr:MAG: hypothetical protein COB56_05425 [Robiginitomaculum sp.]
MIWLIMGVIVLGVFLYVSKPLYIKNAPLLAIDSEVTDYLEQIADIDARLKNAGKSIDVSALELAKVELQRQVLGKAEAGKDSGPQTVLLSTLFVAFVFGAIGIYAALGRPELTKINEITQNTASQDVNDVTLEQAVAQLGRKLAQGDQNPQGWILYARSLMSLRRYDDAITAYEKVLLLTDNNAQLLEEFESAKEYIAQKQTGASPSAPGPSAEQMQAAAAMTPEARQDMIMGMVEGLSQKLKDNPNDADGWVRLLSARKVLGQETEALADIALMRATFKDSPEVVQKILSETGWSND